VQLPLVSSEQVVAVELVLLEEMVELAVEVMESLTPLQVMENLGLLTLEVVVVEPATTVALHKEAEMVDLD
jgi:hypothetical protein